MRRRLLPSPIPLAVSLALTLVTIGPADAVAQNRPNLRIDRGAGSTSTVAVQLDRGYASVPLSVLADLGSG